MVYDKIFSKTDVIFNILQTKIINIPFFMERMNETLHSFQEMRENFENIHENFKESNLTDFSRCDKNQIKEKRASIFCSILNDVVKNIETRYKDFKNLNFI